MLFNIIIDTREQQPFAFPPYINTMRGTLKTGDYALQGDDKFSIERKSLNDFVGTITTNWDRFLREIDRMKNYQAKIIIIESDFESICFKKINDNIINPDYTSTCTPQFINTRIAQLSLMGCCCLFGGNKSYSMALCLAILQERFKQLKKENEKWN